jgi:SulP family sulfate permease
VELVPDPEDDKRRLTEISLKPLQVCPQVKMLRVDGSLFFGAVNHFSESIQRLGEWSPGQRQLLILANGINFIDAAGAEALIEEARRRRKLGGDLYLCGLKHQVRTFLERGGFLEELGRENVFDSKYDALARIFEHLNRDTCGSCQNRVFMECHILHRQSRKWPQGVDADTPAVA